MGFPYHELIDYIKSKRPTPEGLQKEKLRLCKGGKIPSNFEILLRVKPEDLRQVRPFLKTKPTRTSSGVAVVALMTKPTPCPHGRCHICPGGPDSVFGEVPQSYTGAEPATRRAIRNNYDPYLQVFNRLEQYTLLGHNIGKVELIIMGGTFPAQPLNYQEEFVAYTFKALNDFSCLFMRRGRLQLETFKRFFELPGDTVSSARVKSVQSKVLKLKGIAMLEREQARNERAWVRCVGLCVETRPDCCGESEVRTMLRLGCTRVELGVQSLDDRVLKSIGRGHGVQATVDATQNLKKNHLKVGYHMMLGLPGTTLKREILGFRHLFEDERFRPDFLKIYPCLVVRGTKLYELWKAGEYRPLTIERTINALREIKQSLPEYVRVMRIQRDIPSQNIAAGPNLTNLRQRLHQGWDGCRCIRCREPKANFTMRGEPKYRIISYDASGGKEYFISCEIESFLLGFCRLRLDSTAGVRELHVHGEALGLAESSPYGLQHRGIGKRLMQIAEGIASQCGYTQIRVISAVGVRGYYRRLGYKKEGVYMVKRGKLFKSEN